MAGVYGVSFDRRKPAGDHLGGLLPAGSMTSSCKLITKVKAPSDFEPKGIVFQPRWNADRHRLLQRGESGHGRCGDPCALPSPPISSITNNGWLGPVGWSADGEMLYAGGTFDIEGTSPIIAWPDARAWLAQRCSRGHSMPSSDLTTVPEGGIAFASADPAFGIVQPDGTLLPWQNGEAGYPGPITADMRTKRRAISGAHRTRPACGSD